MVSVNAFKYVVCRLFDIVGINDSFEVIANGYIRLAGHDIYFYICDDVQANALVAGKLEYEKTKVNQTNHDVVVFPKRAGHYFDVDETTLKINIDLITLPFLLLSRKEEIGKPKDKYRRFSYEDSLAHKYEFIEYPIVDEYAYLLKEFLEKYLELKIEKKEIQVLLTHDIDALERFGGLIHSVKSIFGGDLVRRRNFRLFRESLKDYLGLKCGKKYDPELEGMFQLLNISITHNLKSEFYFMGSTQDGRGVCYDLESLPEELLKKIDLHGMKMGFHGDLGTSEDENQFMKEKNVVSNKLRGRSINRGRQHYLMFNAEKTPRIWEHQGIRFDSTLGFFDREGFMCGTCHEYPLYDLENDCELSVIERPLLVMDCTLKEYRGLSKAESLKRMLSLYENVKKVNGQMVVLWHNGCTYREWKEWFKEVYCTFIEIICKEGM